MLCIYRYYISLIWLMSVMVTNVSAQNPPQVLKTAIKKLSQIENCQYVLKGKDSAPFDTANFVYSYIEKLQGYRNLEDSVVGYAYKRFVNDTTRVNQVYDGKFLTDFNLSKKEVILKDMLKSPGDRFIINSAFYHQVQTLLEYFFRAENNHYQILWQNSDDEQVDISSEVHQLKVVADNDSILNIELHFNSHRIEVQGK